MSARQKMTPAALTMARVAADGTVFGRNTKEIQAHAL
jgi:hypothetical protein